MKSLHRAALSLFTTAIFPAPLLAQWSAAHAANFAIADFSGHQALPLVAAGGDGTTWIAWFDQRGGTYAVYAQRLNQQGKELCPHGGVLVSDHPQSSSPRGFDLISDGAGGCVIAFTDTRNGPDLDVFAYRLDPLGNPLWGANGVTLSGDDDEEANPVLALTTDGFFVCAWSHTPSAGPGAIRIQRLRDNSNLDYPHNGLVISGSGTERPGAAQIVASDSASYIVSYTRDIAATSGNRHLLVQKFDDPGTPQWNGGAPVSVYDGSSLPIAHQHQLRSDGAGGAVFAWHRSITAFEVMTQRLDANGADVFPHNGVVICADTTIELEPALSIEPQSGDAFIFFNKADAAQTQSSLSVQRISTTGALLFGPNGIDLIPIEPVLKSSPRSVPYADGAAVCCFRATGAGTHDLITLGVHGTGGSVWGAPVLTSSVVSGKQSAALATDSSHVLRLVWSDNRTLSNGIDLYEQNVNVDGTLGPPTTPNVSYCLGDGSLLACPCGNDATSPGHGCASAQFPGGARLRPTGNPGASDLTDSLFLIATDVTGPALFFQSNSIGARTPLGDGFTCAGSGLIRLGVDSPDAGIATYRGNWTDLPIHFAGGPISPGDFKYYQCWYRSFPALCTPGSNFNLTPAVEVQWGL